MLGGHKIGSVKKYIYILPVEGIVMLKYWDPFIKQTLLLDVRYFSLLEYGIRGGVG